MTPGKQRIDPVTVEIIQNRLTQIGLEAGVAMVRAAASPAVVGSKDLGFNIADHMARTIVYSVWMPRHGTTLAFMLRACIERFSQSGISPGDMIMVNNPYDGALHLNDIALIAPVHYEGELIAWTGCATHHLDIRAMAPGMAGDATSWFQEGIVFRPIKLVEAGKLRQDVFDFILDNVRVPQLQGLDLKAQIAANNVAREKIGQLAEHYGVETLKTCYEEIIGFSEAKTRARIRMLPEGNYESVQHLDYDRDYTFKCVLRVKGDTLHFDFKGTDPQAPTFINSALACSVANVHNIITCLLVPDIPANEGCFRPVTITIPDKTLLNCQPPFPSAGASTIGGWMAQILATEVLSKALAASSEAWRANASWGWAITHIVWAGMDSAFKPYVCNFLESMMQGGGARANKDGFDVSNIAGSTNTSIPNVEFMEQRYPVLYVRRGLLPDSGGAGEFRGGLTGYRVFKLHRTKQAECLVAAPGQKFPAMGFAGGKPGQPAMVKVKRNTNICEVMKSDIPEYADIKGEEVVMPPQNPSFDVRSDDVMYAQCQGGGGFGNPVARPTEKVLADVVEGYVSVEKARDEYGVVITPGSYELDRAATAELRRQALAVPVNPPRTREEEIR